MGEFVLRDATRADLPAILAMLAEETIPPDREADPGDSRYLVAFEAIEADPNQRLIAAELDGRVVGTMQLGFLPGLSFIGSWRGLIEAVRIVSDLRGQRLGERMILWARSEEHTSELQSLMRISYAVFCLKKKKTSQQ